VTHLSAKNICKNNFQNLSGIEHCVNLQSLEIIANNSDLIPLENLPQPTHLELYTSTTNITPLANLKGLDSFNPGCAATDGFYSIA